MCRICPEVLEKKVLKVVNAFLLICNYLPFEKVLDLHVKNESDALFQIWLKMSQWFWRRRLGKVFNNVFVVFCSYLHFEKGVILHLKKTTWIFFTQGFLVPNLVENGAVVLENIFKSSQCIFNISQLSPLWEGCGPSFDQTWIPFTQECFEPILVDFGPVVLKKKIFF